MGKIAAKFQFGGQHRLSPDSGQRACAGTSVLGVPGELLEGKRGEGVGPGAWLPIGRARCESPGAWQQRGRQGQPSGGFLSRQSLALSVRPQCAGLSTTPRKRQQTPAAGGAHSRSGPALPRSGPPLFREVPRRLRSPSAVPRAGRLSHEGGRAPSPRPPRKGSGRGACGGKGRPRQPEGGSAEAARPGARVVQAQLFP